jgi:serine/threonine-protein kinase
MVGRIIHQYQILDKIGSGGMGDIYKAQDTRLGRFVAIKALTLESGSDPDRRRRFIQEAQAASALNHPNIITIHDILSDDGADFMVMEYVAGKTLVDLIPKGGLRTAQVLKYSVQMADALAAAHQVGIIHRDLKPGNVMVTENGLVKILDFGLAKLADRGPISHLSSDGDDRTKTIPTPLTVEGSIIGTVSYMSPEQAQGHKVDPRSDIFSFGVVLYEMATGVRAFSGDSPLSTLSAILRDEVVPVQSAAPDAPEQLSQVIDRCLRKNPDDRWQTMKDVQMALSALKHESDSGMLYRTRLSQLPSNIQTPTGTVRYVAGQESTTIVPPGATQQNAVPTGQTQQVPVTAAPPPPEPPRGSKAGLIAVVAGIGLMLIAGVGGWMMLKRKVAEPAAVVAVPVPTAPPVVEQPPPVPADTGLTNDLIIEMVQNKLSTSLILSQIRAEKNSFVLTGPEVLRLAKAGVPDAIIDGMRNPSKIPEQPRAPVPTTVAVNPPVKQNPAPPATPQPASSTPATAPAPAAQTPPTPPPAPAPEPVKAAAPSMLMIPDATPFTITLAEDIPASADEGLPVHFTVTNDVRVGESLAIAQGTPVNGAITRKNKIGRPMTMRIDSTTTTGGQKLMLRAVQRGGNTRNVDAGIKTKSKDIAAMAGTSYVAYVDGPQNVAVKH